MGKIEIKSINQKLKWCICGQGCHMCSGTMRNDSTIKDYYVYWLTLDEDYKGFTGFIGNNLKSTPYLVDSTVIKELEEKYGKKLH